ncbi:dipeptidase [Corynebacterium kutscheri]|uniref:Thiol dipeptidase n=1 Tax=Corynebacterium kutscheri TaxID=35755 RepID=A0AB38VPE4_9CORY|nr:dipeptidase [Corynebacterium kutscheri]VEH04626.1 Thiol precursor dipeptidase [Corynebacterium kutscheri]
MNDVSTFLHNHRDKIFNNLKEIVAFNSVHSVPELKEQHSGACAWVVEKLQQRNLKVTEYPVEGGATTIIARKEAVGDAPTVLLYSHYDVVPAGDPSAWSADPFTLTERDGRWYGRGAADCKGNLVMHLAALDAVEHAGGTDLGLIVLIEGSEEMGGAELSELIHNQPELFQCDAILIADSGNAAVGTPTLTTTLRGGAQIDVTVDTLKFPVHSGSFGGAAPDAVAALIRTIDSLRDEHGRTVIDGVDSTTTWPGAAYDPETFRVDAGMLDGTDIMGTKDDNPADMVWARPAISITGFSSTPVAEAVNAVPATASARLNLRVPPGMVASDVADKVKAHLEAHVPWGAKISVTIHDLNNPFETTTDGAATSVLVDCLRQAYNNKELTVIGSGGSIPLCAELLEAVPHAELALFGVEEPQSTIHSPDESVDPNEICDIAIAEANFLLTYR